VKQGEMGNLVLAQPLAPSYLGGLWNNMAGYRSAYTSRFEKMGGWFDTGDAAVMDPDGYISILARADDIIQVAGHRMGTGLLEQVLASHPQITEACVVGAPDKMKGNVPFALAVARAGAPTDTAALLKDLNEHLRTEVGPISRESGITPLHVWPLTPVRRRAWRHRSHERAAEDAQRQDTAQDGAQDRRAGGRGPAQHRGVAAERAAADDRRCVGRAQGVSRPSQCCSVLAC
jgi:propionyl-CoA synthetase